MQAFGKGPSEPGAPWGTLPSHHLVDRQGLGVLAVWVGRATQEVLAGGSVGADHQALATDGAEKCGRSLMGHKSHR